ncbi:MAG: hypothetical protein ACJKSS_01325 [Patescibacteria group bacterium UBA2103]
MNKGFTTTFILVIVMAFTLAGVLAVATRTVSVLKYDRVVSTRAQAVFSAHACAEAGLLSVRDGGSTSGSISDGAISCSYNVSGTTVAATGAAGGVSKSVSVSFVEGNPLSVSSFTGLKW